MSDNQDQRSQTTGMPALDSILDLLFGLAVIVRRNSPPDDQREINSLLERIAGLRP